MKDQKLILPREPGTPSASYRFRLFEEVEQTASATLFLRAVGLGSADRIAVRLNGTEVPAERLRRVYHREGRPAQAGRPLPPHTTCVIDLTPDLVVARRQRPHADAAVLRDGGRRRGAGPGADRRRRGGRDDRAGLSTHRSPGGSATP